MGTGSPNILWGYMTLQRRNMFQARHQALTISEAEAAQYETDQGLESNTPTGRMNVLKTQEWLYHTECPWICTYLYKFRIPVLHTLFALVGKYPGITEKSYWNSI
ncbi:uncharacterized protein LOC117187016 [Drosophila miranda]|uniref:uncharacterized protein LOC117187016 n=1 Tax=Drosophila miranda TaxID=7229 RepID=UPI00143F79F5|nr:uncharacterized protein LOC117187016 [Drosophila miranda]